MKKITLLLILLTAFNIYAQEAGYGPQIENAKLNPFNYHQTQTNKGIDQECDDTITCDNLENGVFINGQQGQKAAIDIPLDANTQITINQIKVTLASQPEPTFVHFKFYKSNDSIPTEIYQEITNTSIIASEIIGFEPGHSFFIRNITLELQDPIVLNGAETTDRFWMSAISDANAWATTDGVANGADITGKAIAMGSDNFDWFTLGDIEGLYEIDADCELLGIADQDFSTNATIYPNPATDVLNISLKNTIVAQVGIYSLSGAKVMEIKDTSNLNISKLVPGVYFVRIQDNNNIVSFKRIIKQ